MDSHPASQCNTQPLSEEPFFFPAPAPAAMEGLELFFVKRELLEPFAFPSAPFPGFPFAEDAPAAESPDATVVSHETFVSCPFCQATWYCQPGELFYV